MTDLNKPLSYLIGAESVGNGDPKRVIESPWGEPPAAAYAAAIGYVNLLDQHDSYDKDTNTGDYGPYLPQTDTARDYGEGVIDPQGPGWLKNLREQFERCEQPRLGQ